MSCIGWHIPQWISFELPSGIEPNYLDYKSSASPAMLWKLVVLRTGLEPVSSPVKGECPNQLDERSINNKYKYTKTFPHILIHFHAESIGFEPMHRLLDDSLANCSFNHSGNSPLGWISRIELPHREPQSPALPLGYTHHIVAGPGIEPGYLAYETKRVT